MEEGKWIALSWITRFTGTLSFIGSSSIICMVLLDRENKLTKPKHRLMLSMSTFDVFSSVANAAATWPYPKETPIYGSAGNMASCKVQFFFLVLGLAVPIYNASLSLLYLLTIRHRMHFTHFATKVEPYLHIFSILIPLIIATVPLAMNDVQPANTYPRCAVSWDSSMVWPLILVPAISFCVCLYSMTMVSCYVRMQSNKMKKYSHCTRQIKIRDLETRATIQQAIYYTLAFSITFLFPLVTVFTTSFVVSVMSTIFYPLQGFWNFLLYVRPNVTKMKQETEGKYLVVIIWNVVFHSHLKNNAVGPKRCKKGDSYKLQGEVVIKNFTAGMDMNNDESSEESKQEINDFNTARRKSESSEESQCIFAPNDSKGSRSDRRTSVFFATIGDDLPICASGSQEGAEDVTSQGLPV